MLLQGFGALFCLEVAWLLQLTPASHWPWLGGPLNLLLLVGTLLLLNVPRWWMWLLVFFFHYEIDLWMHTAYAHAGAFAIALLPLAFWLYRQQTSETLPELSPWQHVRWCMLNLALYEFTLGLFVYRSWALVENLVHYLPLLLLYHFVLAWFLAPIFRVIVPRLQYRQFRLGTKPLTFDG